jgi:aminopeptidase
MENFDTYLNRYAELIVAHGLNIQPGQLVNISCEVAHRDLAYRVAQAAYKRGAHFVSTDLAEPRLSRLRVDHSTLEQMSYAPPHLETKYKELVDERGANLKIVGPEDPDLMLGADPERVNAGRLAQYKRVKYFYDEGIDKAHVHWTVAAGATPAWGQRVFPGKSPSEALSLLWEQIFSICRVKNKNFLELWHKHNDMLQARARKLTEMRISKLHFTGPGTDLVVGLSDRALFKGGSDRSPRGVEFEPNLPTEECFTTPDWRQTSGVVTTTRPFFINGNLIKDLILTFENGLISKFEASQGAETFEAYINSDEGGRRLGEVALVGVDSPVFQSGLVFEEILFDENAACHIAIGSAYKFCLKDSHTLTPELLKELGCNESSVHTDMMISSEQVDVIATLHDGSRLPIITKGEWCTLSR